MANGKDTRVVSLHVVGWLEGDPDDQDDTGPTFVAIERVEDNQVPADRVSYWKEGCLPEHGWSDLHLATRTVTSSWEDHQPQTQTPEVEPEPQADAEPSFPVLRQLLRNDEADYVVVGYHNTTGECDLICTWTTHAPFYTRKYEGADLIPAARREAESLPNRSRMFAKRVMWPETFKDQKEDDDDE